LHNYRRFQKNNSKWENSVVPIAQRFFFRSTKEKSKVITDVRVIRKVVPMKKNRNICSGGEKIYFKKYLEWIFRPKFLKKSCHWKTPLFLIHVFYL